ncbi:Na+/H+ antiporter subunit E [Pseudomonas sp. HR96]|uniref:Na+/H+ antiporter subunit E n=1 Tax=Pseudomonas sp. HR96 TaxID=1027966 RepID=UPI002A754396|nr:Na+/H+ antiporter subunit E [Pseudomonas sp. HR96]WPP01794.1 Na+/H+ antiporter subunit E [Pseudomonas sp. HR96]
MKRLLPAPWLTLALWLLWLLLNLSLSWGQLLLGLLFAVLAPLLMAPLRPLPIRLRKPGTVLRLLGRVAVDMLVSNLQVARSVLALGRREPRSAFVTVPLQLHDANGLAALAAVCTVIPGTVWSELALDRSALLMHVFDLDDEARFIEHFKATYERPLMEIFQ